MWLLVICVQLLLRGSLCFHAYLLGTRSQQFDRVSHPIQIVEPSLHSVHPFESSDMCPISDDFFLSDEVFLESLIQSDLVFQL